MTTEPTFTSERTPTVRVERHFPHPIEKVWRAVTQPEHLGEWFPSPVELDLRPGGAMRFAAFEGDAGATGTVDVVDAPRRLSFSWGADHLTFELTEDGDGTVLALTHSFDDRYGAPASPPAGSCASATCATSSPASRPRRPTRASPGTRPWCTRSAWTSPSSPRTAAAGPSATSAS